MVSKFTTPIAVGALAVLALAAAPASAETIIFNAGTYELADTNLGTVADTLTISVSGGVASFALSGQDDETWSLPDIATPDGGGPGNPFFDATTPSVTSPSWDTGTYPYLTFWSTVSYGGLTIGGAAGSDSGPNLVNLFQSTPGTGQVYTYVPEPAVWALMLAGFAGLGAAVRSRRRAMAAG